MLGATGIAGVVPRQPEVVCAPMSRAASSYPHQSQQPARAPGAGWLAAVGSMQHAARLLAECMAHTDMVR